MGRRHSPEPIPVDIILCAIGLKHTDFYTGQRGKARSESLVQLNHCGVHRQVSAEAGYIPFPCLLQHLKTHGQSLGNRLQGHGTVAIFIHKMLCVTCAVGTFISSNQDSQIPNVLKIILRKWFFQQDDPLLCELAKIVKANNGLWCTEAEKYLLANAKAI